MRQARNIADGGRGPRYARLVVSGGGGSVPVNSTAPVLSFAGSDNSVGVLATSTEGTWTNSPTSYEFTWRTTESGDLGVAHASTYTPVGANAGEELFVRVIASNGTGDSLPEDSNAIIIKPYNSVLPSISGTNSVGQVLTGAEGTWPGSSGETSEWIVGGVGTADTDANYTIQVADAGATIVFRVEGTNAGGDTVADSATMTVRAYNSVVPSISGTPTVGSTLTGSQGTWAGQTSLANLWLNNGTSLGDTDTSYVVQSTDAGDTITFRVTGTNAGGDTVGTSVGTVIRPYNTVAPAITGTNSVGQVLSGTDGTWLGSVSEAGEWLVDAVGTGDTDGSYTIQAADAGTTITRPVTATNPGGDTVAASNSVVVRPYNSAVPTFTGTNSVGQVLTGAEGTWAGESSLADEWIVGGVGTGDTDTSYTIVAADAGDTVVFRVTGTNAGGDTVANSTSVTVRPYNSVLPSISGTPTVGSTLTGAQGTWAGESSLANLWKNAGVSLGDTDTSYTVQSTDAGDTITFEVTGNNAGGDTVATSTGLVIRPYWSVGLVAAGEPWPGGTVTGTSGTVLGATTGPTYEWTIGGVGTGDTSQATFVPSASQYSGSLVLAAASSNAGGSGDTTSNTLTLEPVRGLTRAATVDDYVRATSSVPNLPSAGTILIETTLIANDGTTAILTAWGRDATNPNRFRIEVNVNTSGTLTAGFYYGPNTPYVLTGTAVPGGWSTPARTLLAVRWNGSAVSVSVIVPGGSVTTTTGTITASGTVAHSTSIALAAWRTVAAANSQSCATTQEIAGFNTNLSDADLDALAAAGSLYAWGAYSHGNLVWHLRPDPGDGIEGDLAVVGDLAGATWAITAGTDDLVWGGLNVAV